MAGSTGPDLDTGLLAGLTYACRPDCGLCCYAEPRIASEEKRRLLPIAPEVRFVTRGGIEFIRSNPDGGACHLLDGHRCRAHAARPGPCRSYPLAGYVGTRAQAVPILTCPGIDLAFLNGYAGADTGSLSHGFDLELAELRSRLAQSGDRRLEEGRRRHRRITRALATEGRWVEDDDVRSALRKSPPLPLDDDFPSWDPPTPEDGLELLPMVFDARAGPLAMAGGPSGWEVLELRPEGGIKESLGVVPPPDRLPALSEDARESLVGYLRYWLERDQLFGIVQLDMAQYPEGDVTDHVTAELRQIAAVTVSRASALSKVRGGGRDPISDRDLRQGIRATDQDLLDRPAWGVQL